MPMPGSDKSRDIVCPFKIKEPALKNKCIKDSCAWWDTRAGRCSIKVLAQNLYVAQKT